VSKLVVDGQEKEIAVSDGQNIYDVFKAQLGDDVKKVIAAKADGKLVDLATPAETFTTIEPVYSNDTDVTALEMLRHSTSHLLAQAVRQLYGDKVQYTIGPALTTDFKYGFYYDFDLPEPIRLEDLPKIEK